MNPVGWFNTCRPNLETLVFDHIGHTIKLYKKTCYSFSAKFFYYHTMFNIAAASWTDFGKVVHKSYTLSVQRRRKQSVSKLIVYSNSEANTSYRE